MTMQDPWGVTKGSLISVSTPTGSDSFHTHSATGLGTSATSGAWGDTTSSMAQTIEEQQVKIEELERLVQRLVEEFLPEELV